MYLADCDPLTVLVHKDDTTDTIELEVSSNMLSDLSDYDDFEVLSFDSDYADPADFADLDEYGAYVEKCADHGEAYRLRYADIGDFDFEDEYQGCWDSEERFVEQLVSDCHDIPDWLAGYIDWASMTRDYMMDYSVYEGDEGFHIFRD